MANLRIAELDFDDIKQNLKTYLQGQSEFTDYDFEGSALSVILDILAYNTHYNAYMANMVVNEMFLDSAVKRDSAVSIAKHLGYTPRSARASSAVVNITVNDPTDYPSSITLDEYTKFTVSINGSTYSFVNLEAKTTQPVDGVYTFSNVRIYEGEPLLFNYTVEDPGPAEKFEIPDDNVDTTTIKVVVQNSVGDTSSNVYSLSTELVTLDGTSKVYFLEENSKGRYEIFFGDGILGKQLTAGNIVKIEYLSTNGGDTNVSSLIAQSFTLSGTVAGSSDVDVTTISNSTGGDAKETITSIKFNAPRFNVTQNRAVTKEDYEALIKAKFSQAESVAVWGGEDNDPPKYGKVLISLKPYSGYFISSTTKEQIKNEILANKKVLAIQPEFIDPEYFYVNLSIFANYNPSLTTLSSGQIQTVISDGVETYFSTELNKFNKKLYSSRLVNYLSDLNSSIVSIIPVLSLQKRITPVLNATNVYSGDTTIKFYNKIHPTEVATTNFYINYNGTQTLVNIRDIPDTVPANYEGTGVLWITNADTGTRLISIGTVNYGTGVISITSFTPTGYPEDQTNIQITCELQESSFNLTSTRNQILVLDDSTKKILANRKAGLTVEVNTVVE